MEQTVKQKIFKTMYNFWYKKLSFFRNNLKNFRNMKIPLFLYHPNNTGAYKNNPSLSCNDQFLLGILIWDHVLC